MMATILFDEKSCVGCAACAMACMDEHDLDLAVQHPYRSIFERETPQPDGSVCLTFLSESCRHCPGAPCAAACPTGCIRRDNSLGLTVYDNARCTGCRACYAACPFGVPTFRRDDGKMEKCDGCAARQRAGLTPACVRVCQTGALHLG